MALHWSSFGLRFRHRRTLMMLEQLILKHKVWYFRPADSVILLQWVGQAHTKLIQLTPTKASNSAL